MDTMGTFLDVVAGHEWLAAALADDGFCAVVQNAIAVQFAFSR